jgi:hypothetical protein
MKIVTWLHGYLIKKLRINGVMKSWGNRFFTLILLLLSLTTCYLLPATNIYAYTTNMPATVVVGQRNFTSNGANAGGGGNATAYGYNNLLDIASNGTNLIVGDYLNHRVLIYNQIPTTNFAPADIVVGQTNFTNRGSNPGGIGANTLANPSGVATDGTRLFIGDYSNSRILIFNHMPTSNNARADVVVGQPDMVTNSTGTTASKFANASGVEFDPVSGKLIIADSTNSRVLIYNQVPTTNGAPADVVIGQPDFVSGTANQGGSVAANTLSGVRQTKVINGKLIVSDFNNQRVLIYNSIPTVNNSSADVVIGQQNFSGGSANQGGSVASNTLYQAYRVVFDGKRLIIPDSYNHRIVFYNGIPDRNNASAYMVIGQPNFTSNSANQGVSVNANTLQYAIGVALAENKVMIADQVNHRVLIFPNIIQPPGLSVSNNPQGAPNNMLSMTGFASLGSDSLYRLGNVTFAVNGGVFNSATPSDGAFDGLTEGFSFLFDPNSNKVNVVNTMEERGRYTLRVQATNTNLDVTDNLFFFQPFKIANVFTSATVPSSAGLSAKALAEVGALAKADPGYPIISFNILGKSMNGDNQQLFTDVSDNVVKLQVQVKRICGSGGGVLCDWEPYLDNIPIDYTKVQNSSLNKQKNELGTSGNGTYETDDIYVVYSGNNSSVTVVGKGRDIQGNAIPLGQLPTSGQSVALFGSNGTKLPPGIYKVKVVAYDKQNHTQETPEQTIKVLSSSNDPSLPFFPLSLSKVTGGGSVNLSTENSQANSQKLTANSSITTSSTTPTFTGIAFAGSTVTLSLVEAGNDASPTTLTAITNPSSRYALPVPKGVLSMGGIYQGSLTVTKEGSFNALPPFTLEITENIQPPLPPLLIQGGETGEVSLTPVPTPPITPSASSRQAPSVQGISTVNHEEMGGSPSSPEPTSNQTLLNFILGTMIKKIGFFSY